MVSKKLYITIFIILFIFTVSMLYYGIIYQTRTFILAIDPQFKLKYDGEKWSHINDNKSVIDSGYEVYDENGYLGKYKIANIENEKRWAVYDDSRKEVDKIGKIVAYKTNIKTDYIEYKQEEITEKDLYYIDKNLKSNTIELDSKKAMNLHYSVDLNNDGKKDTILISNLLASQNKNQSSYTLILSIINKKETVLYYKFAKEGTGITNKSATLSAVLDIKKDGEKELLFSFNSYGESQPCLSIFKLKHNKYEKELSC
ncbi:MAG: hypothetical protein RR745_00880 [Bacilli bacterium]